MKMEFSIYIHCVLFLYLTMESLVLSRPSGKDNLYASTTERNVSNRRRVRLRSLRNGKFLTVLKNEINARGDVSSEHVILELETVHFGKVLIRGEASNRYICFSDKHGKLIAKSKPDSQCVFKQCMNAENVSTFELELFHVKSKKKKASWFVGSTKKGKAKGKKVRAMILSKSKQLQQNSNSCNPPRGNDTIRFRMIRIT